MYSIKNLTNSPHPIILADGSKGRLAARGDDVFDIAPHMVSRYQRLGYLVVTESDGSTAAGAVSPGAYEARETSPGWFKIHNADGEVVGKSMREDEANAFNAMSDADKAASVAETED